MGIISVEQMDGLYWLGRYSDRAYTTIRLYSNRYDHMIDEMADSYKAFCKSMDIPDIYGSKSEFMRRYPFDETDPNSIISNLNRAYDNAVILREEIGSEALSYIQLAIYDMQKAKVSRAPLLEMQGTLDNILAFWGVVDDNIDDDRVRDIIKVGKRTERLNLFARLKMDRKEIERETIRLTDVIEKSGIPYDKKVLGKLNALIGKDEIDYYGIVAQTEQIILQEVQEIVKKGRRLAMRMEDE